MCIRDSHYTINFVLFLINATSLIINIVIIINDDSEAAQIFAPLKLSKPSMPVPVALMLIIEPAVSLAITIISLKKISDVSEPQYVQVPLEMNCYEMFEAKKDALCFIPYAIDLGNR
eukprot:TRINITY_DN4807_c0_g1_i4.p2 TRINITY_DN4807_c0_g1~~TRINITY_DN4807_c0_g1_i4.p2  ORF type:complete len:117 (-),score=28.92 TRINITY_DN4807_c0_g1_i4:104-454(-)